MDGSSFGRVILRLVELYFNLAWDIIGYYKRTVSRVVAQVTDAPCRKLIRLVVWPNENASGKSMEAYFEVFKFPYVFGCVDGSHVRIQAPNVDESAFVNL